MVGDGCGGAVRLGDAGAHVVPVMTDGATRFVGEVTFSALCSEPVRRSLFDDGDPIPHTRLGQGADLVLVAPATVEAHGLPVVAAHPESPAARALEEAARGVAAAVPTPALATN